MAWPPPSGRATSARPIAWPKVCAPAPCGSTATTSSTPLYPSEAIKNPDGAARWDTRLLTSTPKPKPSARVWAKADPNKTVVSTEARTVLSTEAKIVISTEASPSREGRGCEVERPAVLATGRVPVAIKNYGTRNDPTVEITVPAEVVTLTFPVVAPVGTVAVISLADTTLNVAAVPLKLTAVAPVNAFPRILILPPTLPDPGRVWTNFFSPAVKLKMTPSLDVPPPAAVP